MPKWLKFKKTNYSYVDEFGELILEITGGSMFWCRHFGGKEMLFFTFNPFLLFEFLIISMHFCNSNKSKRKPKEVIFKKDPTSARCSFTLTCLQFLNFPIFTSVCRYNKKKSSQSWQLPWKNLEFIFQNSHLHSPGNCRYHNYLKKAC